MLLFCNEATRCSHGSPCWVTALKALSYTSYAGESTRQSYVAISFQNLEEMHQPVSYLFPHSSTSSLTLSICSITRDFQIPKCIKMLQLCGDAQDFWQQREMRFSLKSCRRRNTVLYHIQMHKALSWQPTDLHYMLHHRSRLLKMHREQQEWKS